MRFLESFKIHLNMLNKAINCADLNQAMDSYHLEFGYEDATRRVPDTYDRVVTYYTSALMNRKAQATIQQQRRSIASVDTGSDVKSGSSDKKGPSRLFSKAEWEEMKADGTADATIKAQKKHKADGGGHQSGGTQAQKTKRAIAAVTFERDELKR
jgi:hypothetical protein